ncbi:MAG: hypothetical protein ILO36_08380 [Abditibacteriota bacterium]|nr:hypothetical protein [Abditibacteriota bacterium]
MKYYTDPNDWPAASDAEAIQAAVDEAKKLGLDTVVIPRMNRRRGQALWVIDKAVLLPAHTTLILDGCRLRMADGCFDNMFRNSLALSPEGCAAEGKERDIAIRGVNGAVLDGGLPNGLDEDTFRKEGMPHISANLFIYFHNVEGFEISGFTCKDQRWWAMAFMFCRSGHIHDLRFRLTRHLEDRKIRWRNQDGIDLRIGCSDILIENIEGETGDDFIALTALKGFRKDKSDYVQGENTDIHDVIIRNVRGITSLCAIIRLLAHHGNRIYNVAISDVLDASRYGETAQSQMCLRIGDDNPAYYDFDESLRCKPGDISDISVKNVHTRARTGINLTGCVKNLYVCGLFMTGDAGAALFCGQPGINRVFIYHPSAQKEYDQIKAPVPYDPGKRELLENVLIENVTYEAEGRHAPGVLCLSYTDLRNVTIRNIATNGAAPLEWYGPADKDRFVIED